MFFISSKLNSEWKTLPFPEKIKLNFQNNQGIFFYSNFFKKPTFCSIHKGYEGFEMLFKEKIPVELFELKISLIQIEGKFSIALIIEKENQIIKIYNKESYKENYLNFIEISFLEEKIINSLRDALLKRSNLKIKGFYIFPITKEIAFCIQKIEINKKTFFYFD